jgi:Flp pilus assembly protein TadD
MNETLIANLRRQCHGPRDGSLLRFSLGQALSAAGDASGAIEELRRALAFDPAYSAAWKALGKACLAAGQSDAAADAWRQGIAAAMQRGDKQAEKEMTVFLRRLQKGQGETAVDNPGT